MKKNKKYLQAAKLLVNKPYGIGHWRDSPGFNKFSCYALKNAGNRDLGLYKKYFKPARSNLQTNWLGSPSEPENQIARSLALLFMYEMGIK